MSRLEMVAVGDELLDGRVADTNSQRLARELSGVGQRLAMVQHVTDDHADIQLAARGAVARGATTCVVSGGLGPTSDDVTAAAMAQLAGVPLVRDPEAEAKVRAHVARRGRPMTDNQLRQADRPRGARRLDNPVGTACGFALVVDGCHFLCLPGVPREFDHMVRAAVVAPATEGAPLLRRSFGVVGLAEAEADHRLAPLHARWPRVRLQFRVEFPTHQISLLARAADVADLEAAVAFARAALGRAVFEDAGDGLPGQVLRLLTAHGLTLACAESVTGGLVGDLLTDVPGASAAFAGTIVAYRDLAKVDLLGVSAARLAAAGAVSEEVVVAMAEGARARGRADLGLSTSGLAGPGGGRPDVPVGTLWLGLAWEGGARARRLEVTFGRHENKRMAAMAALDMVRQHLMPPPPA